DVRLPRRQQRRARDPRRDAGERLQGRYHDPDVERGCGGRGQCRLGYAGGAHDHDQTPKLCDRCRSMFLKEGVMWARRFRSVTTDQRGIALPLALILLTVLMSLTLAFLTMGGSEPTIAGNLKSGEMALVAAEAGVERAIWALSNPTVDTAGAGTKLTDLTNIPAPYKTGTQTLFALDGSRAFTVTITRAAAAPNDITLRGDGYVVRNGVTLPGAPTGLAQSDIIGHRVVELKLSGTGSSNRGGGAAAGPPEGDVK